MIRWSGRIRSQSALPPSTPVQESQWHGTSKPLKDVWSGYQGDEHQSVYPFCLNFDQPCVWKIVKVRTVRRNSNPRGSQAPGSKCSKGCCIMLYQGSHRDDVTRSQRDLRSFWHQQDRAGIRSESDICANFHWHCQIELLLEVEDYFSRNSKLTMVRTSAPSDTFCLRQNVNSRFGDWQRPLIVAGTVSDVYVVSRSCLGRV